MIKKSTFIIIYTILFVNSAHSQFTLVKHLEYNHYINWFYYDNPQELDNPYILFSDKLLEQLYNKPPIYNVQPPINGVLKKGKGKTILEISDQEMIVYEHPKGFITSNLSKNLLKSYNWKGRLRKKVKHKYAYKDVRMIGEFFFVENSDYFVLDSPSGVEWMVFPVVYNHKLKKVFRYSSPTKNATIEGIEGDTLIVLDTDKDAKKAFLKTYNLDNQKSILTKEFNHENDTFGIYEGRVKKMGESFFVNIIGSKKVWSTLYNLNSDGEELWSKQVEDYIEPLVYWPK
ncbi:MAG: hypothetical protein GY810_25320 [Aureispira sp.]|nr:hypothetical protein [Aureispira sp.]